MSNRTVILRARECYILRYNDEVNKLYRLISSVMDIICYSKWLM